MRRSLPALSPFVLSLLSVAVANAYAEPSSISECFLEPEFRFSAVGLDSIAIDFKSPRNCARYPGYYDQSPDEVKISPAVPGVWAWSWANRLEFTPDRYWPADTEFTVDLSGLDLPPATKLSSSALTFRSPVLHATSADADFAVDPVVNGRKFIAIRLLFSTQVKDKAALEKALVIDPQCADLQLSKPEFLWLDNDTELLVKVRVLRLPDKDRLFKASFKGLPIDLSTYNEEKKMADTDLAVNIPAISSLYRVESIDLSPAFDKDLKRTQILEIKTSVATAPRDLIKALDVTLLPEKLDPDAASPTDWKIAPVIDAETISRGDKLSALSLTDPDIPVDRIRLKLVFEGKAAVSKGSVIRVALPEGFGPGPDTTLSHGWTVLLDKAIPKASLSFLQPGHMLSLTGSENLTLHTDGVERIRWKIARVRDAFLAMQSPEWYSIADFSARDDAVEVKSGELTLPVDTRFASLNLRKLGFTDRPSGLFDVRIEGLKQEKGKWLVESTDTKRILVTNTALIQKEAADGSRWVFAEDMPNGRPASGIEVTLLAANGLPIETVITDRKGIAAFASTTGLDNERAPVALLSRNPRNGDMAWLSVVDSANLEDNPFTTAGRSLSPDGLTGLLFTERGLYRPGETVRLGAFLASGNLKHLPEGMPVNIEMTDSSGRLMMRKTFPLTPEGLAQGEKELPSEALPGTWDVRLIAGDNVIADTTFRVADFTPEKMKMHVKNALSSPGWLLPHEVNLKLHLTNNFGTDAQNRRVVIDGKVTGSPVNHFASLPGWTFLDPTASATRDERLAQIVLQTDAQGEVSVAPESVLTSRSGAEIRFVAQGFEAGSGRSATDETFLLVSPRESMLGYRLANSAAGDFALDKTRDASVRVKLVDSRLNPVTDTTLHYEKTRIEYRTALYEDDTGEIRYKTEPVGRVVSRGEITTDKNGLGTLPLSDARSPETAGDYQLAFTDRGGEPMGKIPYSLTENGLLMAQNNTLSEAPAAMSAEKSTLLPGEKLTVKLISPFDGTAVLTFESDRVISHSRQKVSEGTNKITLEVPDSIRGKVILNAAIIRDSQMRSRLQQGYATASISLKVDDPSVTVKPSFVVPASVSSPHNIPVTIKSDRPGRFFVWAVDEGILGLTKYCTPDPKEKVLFDRSLQVKTYRTLDELMPEDIPLPSAAYALFGGGEEAADKNLLNAAANPFRRTAEKATVWWGGLMETDAEGRTVTMDLPEGFNGRVRLMAVGAGRNEADLIAMGSCERALTVREPVVLTAALPTFVTPGDKFITAITLTPKTDGSGHLFIKSPDIGMTQKASIKADDEKTLYWNLEAPAVPGPTDFRFAGLFNDTPLTKSVSLGVRPATLKEHHAEWGFLPNRRSVIFDRIPPMTDYEAHATVTVSAAPIPLAKVLFDTFENTEPGDIDDEIERAAAYLAVLESPHLQRSLQLDGRWADDAESVIAKALAKIRKTCGSNGIATYWQKSGDKLVTVRALDFVLSLKRAGRLPDTMVLDQLVSAVRKLTTGSRPSSLGEARLNVYGLMLITLEGTLVPEELEMQRSLLEKNFPGWKNDTVALFFARAYRTMRMNDEAHELEGIKELDMTSLDDLSLFDSISPLASTAVIGHWGEKIGLQPFVDALLAQTPWTLLMTDRSACLTLLADRLKHSKNTRSVKGLTIKCTASDFEHPIVAKFDTDITKTLDFPGCRRFELSSDDTLEDLFWETSVAGYAAECPTKAVREGFYVDKVFSRNDVPLFAPASEAPGAQPLSEATVRAGDIVDVEIRVIRDAGDASSPVVLTDLIPGGFEVVAPNADSEHTEPVSNAEVISRLMGDDRVIWRMNARARMSTLCFSMRAVAPGEFRVPTTTAVDVKKPHIWGRSDSTKTFVIER